MRKYFIITIIIFLAGNCCLLYSQTNDAISYFPLKPGNKWIYFFYSTQFGQSGRFSRQVTSTNNYNGHIYYSYGGYLQRIDSLTANRFYYYNSNGCSWSLYERMVDSLSSRLNDTIRYDCGANYKVCSDTNMRLLFGTMRRTKNFRLGNNGIIFAKNFGIMELYTQSGNVFYVENLIGCIIDGVIYGDTSLVGVKQISSEIPETFSLSQNYPNPFNPVTKIRFSIPLDSRLRGNDNVVLKVYDALGCEVQTLVNEQLSPGTYEVDFDGSNYSSGVYCYTLFAGEHIITKKMIIQK